MFSSTSLISYNRQKMSLNIQNPHNFPSPPSNPALSLQMSCHLNSFQSSVWSANSMKLHKTCRWKSEYYPTQTQKKLARQTNQFLVPARTIQSQTRRTTQSENPWPEAVDLPVHVFDYKRTLNIFFILIEL